MTAPRRYRLAVLAYPAAYRRSRGPELLATLADGDAERGRPSTREVAALAYGGLRMRAGQAGTADGMLVAAAAVALLALTGGFTWAERTYLLDGHAAAYGSDGPGFWWQIALSTTALMVLAIGPSGAWDRPRRRMVAILLASPLALAVFAAPGRIFYAGPPDPAALSQFADWAAAAIAANWVLTVPASIGSTVAVAAAFRALDRLRPAARSAVLAGALASLSAVCVAQSWHRPDLSAEYGRSAFADLGAGAFITASCVLLALISLARMRRAPSPAAQR